MPGYYGLIVIGGLLIAMALLRGLYSGFDPATLRRMP
jgi:hypothetical protein